MGKQLGLKIKQLRSEYSLKTGEKFTQADLAKKLSISRSYLGDIESGRTIASNELLNKIANIFNIDSQELLYYKLNELDAKCSHINEEVETYECSNSILKENNTSLTGIVNKTTDIKEIMELILSQPVLTLNGKILNEESKIALENAIKMALAYAEQKQKENNPII